MPYSPTFDAGRFAVLELIARGRALPDVLDRIVRLIEAQREGLLASILLVDQEENVCATAPRPACPRNTRVCSTASRSARRTALGTAAYLGQRVIVEDISTHPYWEGFAQFALRTASGRAGPRRTWRRIRRSSARSRCITGNREVRRIEVEWVNAGGLNWRRSPSAATRWSGPCDAARRGIARSSTRPMKASGPSTRHTGRRSQIAGWARFSASLRRHSRAARCSTSFTRMTVRNWSGVFSRRIPGQSEEVEFRIRRTDGTERRVMSSVSPIMSELGEVAGALGFVRDVTDR